MTTVNKFNHNDLHKRGEIEAHKDVTNDTFYRVYRGCKFVDDYFTCDTLEHAKRVSQELILIDETYNQALSDVKSEIEKIVEKHGNSWDSIEVNWPLELIHNAINELHRDR